MTKMTSKFHQNDTQGIPHDPTGFSDVIVDKMLALEGRNISVKDVADLTRGGQMPTGTAKYEKRDSMSRC